MGKEKSNFNKLLDIKKYEWDSSYISGETNVNVYFKKDFNDRINLCVDFDKSWLFKEFNPSINDNFNEYQLKIMSDVFGAMINSIVYFIDERRAEIIDMSIKEKCE